MLDQYWEQRIQAFLSCRVPGRDLGVGFGCGHNPIQHKGYQQWRNSVIREVNPDWLINLGDAHEATYASRWPNDAKYDAKVEFNVLADDFRQLNEAAPNAKKVWLEGNHDDNARQPGRITDSLRDLVQHYREMILEPEIADWKIIPYGHDKKFQLGQITFQHGSEVGVNAGRKQAILYGVPFGLHVSAHTHRPIPPELIVLPGNTPVFAMHHCNVGTGANWDEMHYMDRNSKALWGRGLLLFSVNCKQKRAWFGSKQWDADLLIHSMANERACR